MKYFGKGSEDNDGYTDEELKQLELERRYRDENIETVPRFDLQHTNPFLTGSRVYGTPNEDSDIDLVVFGDPKTFNLLKLMQDGIKNVFNNCLRFGKLNIIYCTDPTDYSVWWDGTQDLINHVRTTGRTIDKELATFHFDVIRYERNVEDHYDKGH